MAISSTVVRPSDRAFPAIWLRDNCPCLDCRDPHSGQKLFQITELSRDVEVVDLYVDGATTVVTFAPDGHRAIYSTAWLDDQAVDDHRDDRSEVAKRLWSGRDLRGSLPAVDWVAYVGDTAVRARALRAVAVTGFVLLRATPTTPGTVLDVARSFGYVRETNYGELFDVRITGRANNLAFTDRAIAPHTDNPYRDPVPTLQLLHCLANDVEGGETTLVDGFLAAALLREESPESFEVLADTAVRFTWSDERAALSACRPLIEVDADGRVRGVRFNNRSMDALRGPRSEIAKFYDAYRAFGEIVGREELAVTFALSPGECLLLDNTRVLHARAAFRHRGGGSRHLQGCYADIDALFSAVTTLERNS